VQVTRIGAFVADQGIAVLDRHGTPIQLDRAGWSHF
jgi:hypothetical protein